jgi:hypothetical protein
MRNNFDPSYVWYNRQIEKVDVFAAADLDRAARYQGLMG